MTQEVKPYFDLLSKDDQEQCQYDVLCYGVYYIKTEIDGDKLTVIRIAPEDNGVY